MECACDTRIDTGLCARAQTTSCGAAPAALNPASGLADAFGIFGIRRVVNETKPTFGFVVGFEYRSESGKFIRVLRREGAWVWLQTDEKTTPLRRKIKPVEYATRWIEFTSFKKPSGRARDYLAADHTVETL